ncbi:MAG: MgtC/SapB family protein [Acidobacteria bacterium]|nr:MgtC/SapB family protein [Acidobacteriota bacterium]
MPSLLQPADIVIRMLLSVLLAAPVGWERESLDKPAGLRTHLLVGLGSACFTLAGLLLYQDLGGGDSRLDPTRIVQGVAGGIGFLGAGTILKAGQDPKGLTTAAGVWTVGAVGVACGLGYFLVAGLAALAALLVLLAGRLSALHGASGGDNR